jgi:hypothetical protein
VTKKIKYSLIFEKELMEKRGSGYFRCSFIPKLAALDLPKYYTADTEPH